MTAPTRSEERAIKFFKEWFPDIQGGSAKIPALAREIDAAVEEGVTAKDAEIAALKNDLADARTLLASPECFGNGPEWREQVRVFLDRARSPSHEFLAIIEEKKVEIAALVKERDSWKAEFEEARSDWRKYADLFQAAESRSSRLAGLLDRADEVIRDYAPGFEVLLEEIEEALKEGA